MQLQNLHQEYNSIEKSFKDKDITFDQYSSQIIDWNNRYGKLIKKSVDNSKFGNDQSHGGKLHKKVSTDKLGKKTTKWVSNGQDDNNKESDSKKSVDKNNADQFTYQQFKQSASKASENALKNALQYAPLESVRKLARHELLTRKENLKSYIDFSLMPDFILNSYVEKYKIVSDNISPEINKSLSKYRDNDYVTINKNLRNSNDLSNDDMNLIDDLDTAIKSSKLQHDICLFRGINGKDSNLFVNYLKSLSEGDIYEEKSYSSSSLVQGQANKFKDLYKDSHQNYTLKIYASKGQNALCMQNLGGEDNKEMYKDEFEFLLARESKFQIISNQDNQIEIKLL